MARLNQAVPVDSVLSHDPYTRLFRYTSWWEKVHPISQVWVDTLRFWRTGRKYIW
jgi:hypothetical protein